MARIVLLILAIIAALILFRWLKRQPLEKRWKVIATLIAAVLLVLVATGRMHWLFALIGAALPVARRLLGLLRFAPLLRGGFNRFSSHTPSSGQQSLVETQYLSMSLDHDSGALSGRIKDGEHAGLNLQQLSQDQLIALHQNYCQLDPDSEQLLGNYIDRTHGTEWRAQNQSNKTEETSTAQLSENEAYAILGLEPGADKQSILKAHKQLMQKIHPDRGGSSYLAVKINQARDLLITQITD
ncbi:MAG: DnaJ domain-containing protein [Gammaproteobacteria bacterium]|nr:DnaJ domain-containing protein [Gammaproteobacteria bacterium]